MAIRRLGLINYTDGEAEEFQIHDSARWRDDAQGCCLGSQVSRSTVLDDHGSFGPF